jgi:glucose uptake protein GlcU
VNGELAVPAFISGLLWAVAQTSFFIANEKLSQTVTFPIIGSLPGVIAACWSVFVFREIRVSKRLFSMASSIYRSILRDNLISNK